MVGLAPLQCHQILRVIILLTFVAFDPILVAARFEGAHFPVQFAMIFLVRADNQVTRVIVCRILVFVVDK